MRTIRPSQFPKAAMPEWAAVYSHRTRQTEPSWFVRASAVMTSGGDEHWVPLAIGLSPLLGFTLGLPAALPINV
jgi:hypothetical protein